MNKLLTVLSLFFYSSVVFGQGNLTEADKAYDEKIYDRALSAYLENQTKLTTEQQFRVGKIYGEKDAYTEAISWYKKAADNDHPQAMNDIGEMYYHGLGVQKDGAKAFTWLKKAADKGNTDGIANVGFLYQQGVGVAQDYKEAVIWLTKAAEKTHANAMFALSMLYNSGKGVTANLEMMLEWLRRSAIAGSKNGMYTLGLFNSRGLAGMQKNYVEAKKWLFKAADAGSGDAMFEIGHLYINGFGVEQDSKQALSWIKKAAELKQTEAQKFLPKLEKALKTLPEMVKVEGGIFKMGASDKISIEHDGDPHNVTLQSYSIGKYEVTVAEYRAFCTASGASMPSLLFIEDWEWVDSEPIVLVSWFDAEVYCKWLSSITNKTYRLPTEAEWEYAAKGGNKSQGYTYSGGNDWKEVSWNKDNSNGKLHSIGLKKPNELGIYDMSGNASEWCNDWYAKFPGGSLTNPTGPALGESKIRRGGDWGGHFAFGGDNDTKIDNRSSTPLYRFAGDLYNSIHMGFRVVAIE